MSVVSGSTSSIPPSPSGTSESASIRRGGDVEPNTPMSRELTLAIAKAHREWARRFCPHLLEEWLNG